MKKIVFIIALALSASFWGCGSDDEETTLRWDNTKSGKDFAAIDWIKGDDPNTVTTWDEDTGPSGKPRTDYKQIAYRNGNGEGIDNSGDSWEFDLSGSAADGASGVVYANGPSATIEKNAEATLVILKATKK